MRKYFIASLCKNGILGGGIQVTEDAVLYHTEKLTVPEQDRRIVMNYSEICGLTPGWLLFLPTVNFNMRHGEEIRFVIFARKAFIRAVNAYRQPEKRPD